MENLEIISREIVRPSYPTPQNLQTYKISMLDQAIPSVLSPIFLYYNNDDAATNINGSDSFISCTTSIVTNINGSDSFISHTTSQLKKSLSAILTRYYPFAGRASGDGLSIDCNDEGVPFVVAKFRGHSLSNLLKNNPTWRKCLIPCDLTKHAHRIVLQIQINYFDCGGVAVASVFWHRASDAVTMAAFLQSWAAAARAQGSNQAVCPNYISPSLFPQTQYDLTQIHPPLAAALLRRGRSVLRSYTFDAAAIAALKAISGLERASRTELASALIWNCFMAASREINGEQYPSSVLLRAVNLRRRAYPAFSADCFGNFQGLAAASSSNDGANDIGELVRRMRDSLVEIGGDYVESLRGEGGAAAYVENRKRILLSGIGKGADCLFMTSLCGLGFNGCDFGWGKPVRCGTYGEGSGDSDSAVFANSVSLVDSRDGDGIEVGIVLDSRYVSPFENHLLLLLPTPPPPQSSSIHNHTTSKL